MTYVKEKTQEDKTMYFETLDDLLECLYENRFTEKVYEYDKTIDWETLNEAVTEEEFAALEGAAIMLEEFINRELDYIEITDEIDREIIKTSVCEALASEDGVLDPSYNSFIGTFETCLEHYWDK